MAWGVSWIINKGDGIRPLCLIILVYQFDRVVEAGRLLKQSLQ